MAALLRRRGAKTGREFGKDGVGETVWTVEKKGQNPGLEQVNSLVDAPVRSTHLRLLDAAFEGPRCVVRVLVDRNTGGPPRFRGHKEAGVIVDVRR